MQPIPGVIRVQAIAHGRTNLPKDRYVNTFHFLTKGLTGDNPVPGDSGSHKDEAIERVREFYFENPPGFGNPVVAWMHPSVSRRFEIRAYDLGDDEEPREPTISEYELETSYTTGSGAILPHEVAIAASFYAGRNIARRRGRIFIGPLNAGTLHTTNEIRPTVKQEVRATIAEACRRLSEEGAMDRLDWSVLSMRDREARPVTGGWVDDEFDTIRKRGPGATTRTVWETGVAATG